MGVIIIYFSLTGNTQKTAEIIKEYLESKGYEVSLFRVETEEKGSFLKNCLDALRKRIVKIKNVPSLDYNLVFIGSPVWAFDITPAIRSFIEKNNFSGKKVFLFTTYGSGAGKRNAMESFKNLIEKKGGEVIGTLEVKGKNIENEKLRITGVVEKCLKEYQQIEHH